jgi:phage tail-like protein
MATYRERPYSQFNFRVSLGPGAPGPNDFKAGFQEVSGLSLGNYVENSPMKIAGTNKIGDVTFKRGVIGDIATLYSWIDNVRNGSQNERRTVTVQLMDESRTNPVQQWVLSNAFPTKLSGPSFMGRGTDVAVEELVLMAERIDQK